MNGSTKKDKWMYLLIGILSLLLCLSLIGNALQEASTSAGIFILSGAEEITIYVPVLLDKNNNVLKMYEIPTIEGNVTTTIIDTKYGKALKISGPGLGRQMFSWNDIPGKDTDRFVKWLEDNLRIERPDIRKADDGAIIASGKYEVIPSIKVVYTFRLNEEKNKILYDVTGTDPYCPLFVKEENGKLNVYTGIVGIGMNEKHGIVENQEAKDEFIKGFTVSMSNYTSPSNYAGPINPFVIDAWVYSDREIEGFAFSFLRDPADLNDRRALTMNTIGKNLSKGWQIVQLDVGDSFYDPAPPIPTLTAIPTETPTVSPVSPAEKVAGFEIILAIAALLVVTKGEQKE